ncbi:MAG: family 1 glycosylhydrolase [Chloroflexi bacterium]|nr:family 1 glycosylhydrolase [Chloroflexota bacterium]MCI0645858.1 family 1 glycosylhydrolase [Chloroflexota bacterium]MCI0725713.1 family 1 glycosylhydrolase [Chloroflexota bacterium]
MSDLFSSSPAGFCWATGIEDTFIPQARPGLRALDEYKLTQHDKLWQSDFDLVAESGVRALRWGIPWYQVQPRPDEWDWRWTDKALEYLVTVKGITPILDLMHYGTPLWLDNSFINNRYPELVAGYTRAVAERYHSLVQYYTPLNEPTVNADMCGRQGEWPPYLSGDDGYVKVALALARGIVLATQALKAEQPGAVTVQVEALWHTSTRVESLASTVEQNNARQYLCFDLVTGRVADDYPLAGYLYEHGATSADLAWFRQNAVTFDLFGANFYPWSYTELGLQKNGRPRRILRHTHGDKIAEVINDAYSRYHMPVAITETSARRDVAGRAQWMDETIDAVRNLRRQGIPVVGYTWFPFLTMIDWAYRRGRRPVESYLLYLGLYDSTFDAGRILQRHRTPLVDHYQQHMAQPMPPVFIPDKVTAAHRAG